MRVLCIVSVLLLATSVVFAKDFETPHELQSGDVISADVLNETFAKLGNARKSVTTSDLVGTWTCYSYGDAQQSGDPAVQSHWVLSGDGGLYLQYSATITFGDDGDETYSLKTLDADPFVLTSALPVDEPYEVIANMFCRKLGANSAMTYQVERISETRLVFRLLKVTASAAYHALTVILDKQDFPSAIPTKLRAITSGLTVTLSWTDSSDDETGFRILRRDTLTGTYSEIATADADATTYTDTLTIAAKYWYRVKATNANGDSLGSNVVKVTVTE